MPDTTPPPMSPLARYFAEGRYRAAHLSATPPPADSERSADLPLAFRYAIGLMENQRDVAGPAHVPVIQGHIDTLRRAATPVAESGRVEIAERVVATIENALEDQAPEWLEAAFADAIEAERRLAAAAPPARHDACECESCACPDPAAHAAPPAAGLDVYALEREFEKDAARWLKQGSGMTTDQETGAAMAFSWLHQRERDARARLSGADRVDGEPTDGA